MKPCPRCRKEIDDHATTCPHCQSDIVDHIRMDQLDPGNPEAFANALYQNMKRRLWHDSLRVVLTSALSLALFGVGVSVYQNYDIKKSLTQTLQPQLKDEISRKLELDVTREIHRVIGPAIDTVTEIEGRLAGLNDRVIRAESENRNQLAEIEQLSTSARAELESAQKETQRLRLEISQNEQAKSVVNELQREVLSRLAASTQQLETLDVQVGGIITVANNVQELSAKAQENRKSILRQQERANAFVTRVEMQSLVDANSLKGLDSALAGATTVLVSPSSDGLPYTRTYFGKSIEFQWYDAEPGPEYILQVSDSSDFSNIVIEKRTKLTSIDINMCGDIARGCLTGPVFWRVASTADVANWSKVGAFESYQNSLDRIKKTGVMRIAISATYSGIFSNYDTDLGKYVGFEVDLMDLISQRLSLKLGQEIRIERQAFPWIDIFSSVKQNRVDAIVSSVSVKEIRRNLFGISFSVPYYEGSLSAVVPAVTQIESVPDAFKNKVIVAQERSVSVELARTLTNKVIEVSSTAEAFQLIRSGDAYAAIMDTPFAVEEISKTGDEASMRYLRLADDSYALVVSVGEQDLLNLLDAEIKLAFKDGSIAKLYAAYQLVPERVNTLM